MANSEDDTELANSFLEGLRKCDDFEVVNDPDGTYAELANSIIDDLRKCNDFDELARLLFSLSEPRNEAIAEGDQLAAAVFSYFIDGALVALLQREPPQAQLNQTVAEITAFAADGLTSWDISLGGLRDCA